MCILLGKKLLYFPNNPMVPSQLNSINIFYRFNVISPKKHWPLPIFYGYALCNNMQSSTYHGFVCTDFRANLDRLYLLNTKMYNVISCVSQFSHLWPVVQIICEWRCKYISTVYMFLYTNDLKIYRICKNVSDASIHQILYSSEEIEDIKGAEVQSLGVCLDEKIDIVSNFQIMYNTGLF